MLEATKFLRGAMPLAGLFALATVALSLPLLPTDRQFAAAVLLAVFTAVFVWFQLTIRQWPRFAQVLLLLMPVVALTMIGLAGQTGVPQVLLVIWIVCVFKVWPTRLAVVALLLGSVALYLLLRAQGVSSSLTTVLISTGFQALAAICVYYARSAEHARDRLLQVNADLLATRSLLADSTRDAERLRLARELHDVAGHKLTAMHLNLRELVAESALPPHAALTLCERLAGELLEDLRGVVGALRDERGLDLETALRALAAPLPRLRLDLRIAPQVRVADPAVAEVLLRVVQEAMTNAARHAGASRLCVELERDGAQLHLTVEDDGHVRGALREGNGLAGMRERLEAVQGTLAVAPNARGALRIEARLPA
jgi:signal transduction histidine kinase